MSLTEKNIQNEIRLHLSKAGALSLRYQVGLFYSPAGDPVKIGEVGASDLICCVPILITQEMVGKTLGVFAAIETKKINDKTAKGRKESQDKFINRVQALGGIAGIARSTEDVEKLISEKKK
jgi:hypothetical protein